MESREPVAEGEDIEILKRKLDACEGINKLEEAIRLMDLALAQKSGPDFKTFWEARRIALELFQDAAVPPHKTLFWSKYKEITKQAKRLRSIMEAETAFAVEQIDIAIKALCKEVDEIDLLLERAPLPDISRACRSIKSNFEQYIALQKELNLLNAFASRVNALRKELIKTDMRIGQKNIFFKMLSSVGDAVFPRRKELVKRISTLFSGDVEDFVRRNFSADEAYRKRLFGMREEIKAFQKTAGSLSLNTACFSSTRRALSTCWQKIKACEKEFKKAEAEFKEVYQKNYNDLQEKIAEVEQSFAKDNISAGEAKNRLESIGESFSSAKLGKAELKKLNGALKRVLEPVAAKIEQKDRERLQEERKKAYRKKERIAALEAKISSACREAVELEVERISEMISEVENEISTIEGMANEEREILKRSLVPLRDLFCAKEEQKMLDNLSEEGRERIKVLETVLAGRNKRREEIKREIERLRKISGRSGLDFTQSMRLHEKISGEKQRLNDINESIDEIESQIRQIKNGACAERI